ncbi:MAG: type II toxin-antitoxin system RelE/ParE family toxin [Treponematales bacterium]
MPVFNPPAFLLLGGGGAKAGGDKTSDLRYYAVMRRFKDKSFARFARRARISDDDLLNVIAELEAGQIDADLGGYVYKQRVARRGGGKRGGYRVLLFFKSGERIIFYDGFAKSSLDNIKDNDLMLYKRAAKYLMGLTDEHLDALVLAGKYVEF